MRSENILHVGAHVDIPMEDGTLRHCEVIAMHDDGFVVQFFTPDGMGPYTCSLPHGEFPEKTIHRTLYQNEGAGPNKSFWKWNGDFTGDYDEAAYIRKLIKPSEV